MLAASVPAAALAVEDADGVAGVPVDTSETDLVRQLKETLVEDPAQADALAYRIMESRVAGQFSESDDPEAAFRDIRAWIRKNPESAAYLAVGFAKDDAGGTQAFEESLVRRVAVSVEMNPDRHKGILGRLDRAAQLSKTVGPKTKLDEEEQARLIKQIFEGKSTIGGQMDRRSGSGTGQGDPDAGSGGPAIRAGAGLYDRIGAANPTGYSPRVMALQSEMNRGRPPGAPRLIETGHLDYATLRYPYHGLRYDIDRLGADFRAQRAWAAARLLKLQGEYPPERMRDPAVQKELENKARGKAEDPEFARRSATLDKARAALSDFDREADKTRKKRGITPARLRRLSEKRREAARWITVASLEETVQRLKAQMGFLTQPLRDTIMRAPVPDEERRRYLGRGDMLKAMLDKAVAQGERARSLLIETDEAASWVVAENLIVAVRAASKRLPGLISEYRETPAKLLALHRPVSGWRGTFDDYVLKFLPNIEYSRKLKRSRKEGEAQRAAFLRIANTS
ncbi:hypothetical protein ACFL2T_01980 [Elusimicrobiota bacterium]